MRTIAPGVQRVSQGLLSSCWCCYPLAALGAPRDRVQPNRRQRAYYFYKSLGMLRVRAHRRYTTQAACDSLGRSQTENGAVNQVGLTCDADPAGCIVGNELLVTATDRCAPATARCASATRATPVTVRIVDRTPGNGGFDLGLDPYIDLGPVCRLQHRRIRPQDLTYECLP